MSSDPEVAPTGRAAGPLALAGGAPPLTFGKGPRHISVVLEEYLAAVAPPTPSEHLFAPADASTPQQKTDRSGETARFPWGTAGYDPDRTDHPPGSAPLGDGHDA